MFRTSIDVVSIRQLFATTNLVLSKKYFFLQVYCQILQLGALIPRFVRTKIRLGRRLFSMKLWNVMRDLQ